MNLRSALTSEAKINCCQIALQMEKKNQSFQETMLETLMQKNASEQVIKQFKRENKNEYVPFTPILQAIKEREGRNW